MTNEQRYLEPRDSGGWSWSKRPRHEADEPDHLDPGDDADAPVYVISVAAQLSGLHPQTLRAYEREGLLTPARTQGGTRRYSQRDVERLQFIRTLTQDEGLNLAGVRVVLELGEKLEAARRRVADLEEMVRVLADRLEERSGADRYAIVKSAPSNVEVHPLRRRTGQRGGSSAQRARPVPPPDRRVIDA